MKRLACLTAALLVAGISFGQTDSTAKNSDTVKVGNFIIIKKNKGATSSETVIKNSEKSFEYRIERRSRRRSNISTNWFIFDLGFANYRLYRCAGRWIFKSVPPC